jgi:hypothetical protein
MNTISNPKTLSALEQEKRRKRSFHDPRAAGPFKDFAAHMKMTPQQCAREVLTHIHEYAPARVAQAKAIAAAGKMMHKKKNDTPKSNPPKSDAGTDTNPPVGNPNVEPSDGQAL